MTSETREVAPGIEELQEAERQVKQIRDVMRMLNRQIDVLREMGPKDTLVPAATFFKMMVDLSSDLKDVYLPVYHYMEHYQQTILPKLFERESTDLAKTLNGYTVKMTTDFNVSIPADRKPDAYSWLEQNGYGDIISTTINSSTLKATVKTMIESGVVIPEDVFKAKPFVKMRVNASSRKIPDVSYGSTGEDY